MASYDHSIAGHGRSVGRSEELFVIIDPMQTHGILLGNEQ